MYKENQLKVIHSDGTIELFRPRLIKEQLLEETDISEDIALKIQRRVSEKLKKLDTAEVSTTTIRAEVSAQLTSRGLLDEERESRKLGMSVKEFEDLIKHGCRDNANIQYSPELIAKYAYDSIAKEYALLDMPEDCAKAHIDGLMHCLSGNNDLIVKINDDICVMNIVEVIDLYEFQDCYVPSINPLTLKIEWKKIIDGACTGIKPVYELEFAKGYKIECTADHKFLKYNSREQKFNKKYDLRIKDLKENSNIRFGSLNYIPYNNDKNYFESAFFGFFLGDGSLNNNKIQFHLVKQDKIDYITWLLDYLDINYKIKEYSTATQIICENKYEFRDKFSMPIFKLNYTGILEGLINSDGYITTHGKLSTNYLEFDSTNKFITDLFFVACLTLNIRPSYQIIKRKEKDWSNIYRCITQNNHVYNLLHDIKLREGHKQRLSKNKSNINIGQTSGLTLKSITELGEQLVYNITVEDNHNFMAGTQGFILTQNCHDLEYFHTRPNCMNYDLRFFARNGLKVDGKGDMGSVAKPAKTLEVLLNHMLQAWMAGAVVFSGGQGYVNFNTLLAPFAKGRAYDDIKQAIQGFIFNCNMSLICRGGQVLFSSIGLDLSIPDVLKDEPAIGPNGVVIGTYKDYQNEADMIFQAVCEVSNEKDGQGAWHRFPNILFNIRKGDLDKYEGNCKLLHETGANNPTIYYVNCIELERSVMGCRSALPMNYAFDYQKDCCNTGNFMYSTINLPLIALEVDGDEQKFWNKLGDICEIIYRTLHYRRDCVVDSIYNKRMSDFLLQEDKETKKPLYDIDTTTMTIGFCGLNECIEALTGKDIIEEKDLGERILAFLNSYKDQFHDRDGLRWSVIASPAESAAHRFAEINREKYPDCPIQGSKDHYYLTNSSHIPVSKEVDLIAHIKNAALYHPYTLGGNILHLWLGEVWTDPKSLWKMNQKIIKNNIFFWAYSKVFTYCNECGFTLNDDIDTCPICKSNDLVTYDRITGYYLPTNGYNNGKIREQKDRYRQKI